MVKIDEELCNGCGLCVPGCHEGALQIIDGKARLISDLMCDGLGACIGHCPQGAITIEKREAGAYDEASVVAMMIPKGKNTIIAHLKHLKEHKEMIYLKEGVSYLRAHEGDLGFSLQEVIDAVHGNPVQPAAMSLGHEHGGGCPGSRTITIERPEKGMTVTTPPEEEAVSGTSELRQWPVQMHLINPQAPYYRNSDVLIAADCVAFAMGDFHQNYLKGKSIAIACPKLDANLDVYLNKITAMIDYANINTITVMIMQVPCCGGLLQIVKQAVSASRRKIPVKLLMVSLEGKVIQEEWQ
jgi:NAD-dependent dihydropyrimidine dehydrogenase PreA subunit